MRLDRARIKVRAQRPFLRFKQEITRAELLPFPAGSELMPVDMHAHYLPQALADQLRRRRLPPCIETLPHGAERLHLPIGTLAFSVAYMDMEARIGFLDQVGVQRQLLSLGGLLGIHSLPLAEAAPLTRVFNDDVGGLCRRYPDRFLGLAALPLADTDAAVSELRRARRELRLIGAILPVNAFVTVAEAEKLRPVFAAAEELGAHIFVHPGRRPDEVPRDPNRAQLSVPRDNDLARRALDVQSKLAEAMITLLFSDFLDAYPNVSVQVANLGGTLPAVIERMDNVAKLRTPDDILPSSRLRRVYVDCASLGPRAIELAVACYGPDRIVLGSDCPIFRADWVLTAVRETRLAEDERNMILERNAAELIARIDERDRK